MAQAITAIIIVTVKGKPFMNLANRPVLLADNPRLLFHPPANAPWYIMPPVRRDLHNWIEKTLSCEETMGRGNKCLLSTPKISCTAPSLLGVNTEGGKSSFSAMASRGGSVVISGKSLSVTLTLAIPPPPQYKGSGISTTWQVSRLAPSPSTAITSHLSIISRKTGTLILDDIIDISTPSSYNMFTTCPSSLIDSCNKLIFL
jgi:hypothetical protein